MQTFESPESWAEILQSDPQLVNFRFESEISRGGDIMGILEGDTICSWQYRICGREHTEVAVGIARIVV